ncbi:MAG TPA: hypothetical protein G4N94_06370 [Caldilineae bacterium]|nr:hypothetical protein [Caldilineae bacterium]
MKSTDAIPPYETSEIGTPRDYTSDRYLGYFEVGEYQNMARTIIEKYLNAERLARMQILPHGYIVEIPIQITPDIVRNLAEENIGVYQVIRFAKTEAPPE